MIFVNNDTVMGENICFLRQQEGLSLEELGKTVGIDPDGLYAIETGDSMEIDGMVLINICLFFHTDVQTLVEKNLKAMSLRGGL